MHNSINEKIRMKIKHNLILVFISIAALLLTSGLARINEWPDNSALKAMKEKAGSIWKQNQVQVKALALAKAETQQQFYSIHKDNRKLGYGYIARVATCMPAKCPQMRTGSKTEYFDYFMLLSPRGKVKTVNILSYHATRGHEIRNKRWLRQFVDFAGAHELIYGKDIQALSGATISATSMTNDVERVVQQLQQHIQTRAPN